MKIITPISIDDDVLTESNIGETVDEWATGVYYLDDDIVRDDASHTLYESQVGDTPATVTMTIASPCVVTHTAHGMADNDPVEFTTTGALPTGLVAGTTYYISGITTDTYRVAAAASGTEINTSGSQSGTHTGHGNPNRGQDPTAAGSSYWVELGSSNKWSMFDPYIESVSTNPEEIAVTFVPPDRADSLAFFNLDATNINITITDATEGEVYNEDHNLLATYNVVDWFTYFFEPIIRTEDILIENLPLYYGPEIAVTIENPGEDAECGLLIAGSTRLLGGTVYGAGFGILDSSRKETDVLFRTVLTPRSHRKTGVFRVIVQAAEVSEVGRLLTERRAVPSVFSGSDEYDSTLIYGFPRDWRVIIEHNEQSALEIELEGLS